MDDKIDPIELVYMYRKEVEQAQYDLKISQILNKKYLQIINKIFKDHPEIEKEVNNGTDGKSSESRRK